MGHYIEVCQYGYHHSQCRCTGPKGVHKVECNIVSHADSPKESSAGVAALADSDSITVKVTPADVVSIPKDVSEYVTGPFRAKPLTKDVWETLLSALQALDNAYGDNDKIDTARDWLHEQYGDWEN